MCFYLALKVYILYSFFCTTFSPPGRTGSGCPLGRRADGFGTELGKQRWLYASSSMWKMMVGWPLALKSCLSPHSPCPQEFSTAHSDGATLEDISTGWG